MKARRTAKTKSGAKSKAKAKTKGKAKAKVAARTTSYEGGCLCGQIRFVARGVPFYQHSCSCRLCARHSGAPTSVWVVFRAAEVAWTGTGGRPATWNSSEGFARAFCPACGSVLGGFAADGNLGLLIGAFDNPNREALRPRSHTYRSSRPRWWHFETGTPG